MLEKGCWLFGWSAIAAMVGGFATPVLWFGLRLIGLIPFAIRSFGGYRWLMINGGIILGALVGTVCLFFVTRAMGQVDWLGLIFGAVGGAVGGCVSSLLFFPMVAIL